MSSKQLQPTSEQLALSQKRKLKREKQNPSLESEGKGHIIPRKWIQLQNTMGADNVQYVRVLTWNLLAQTLIRRELFPTSDCLKASQREHMLYREILSPGADILFLQEVDRLEKLVPVLEGAGYTCRYATGPKKKHGCMIAYKSTYRKIDERLIHYDEHHVRLNEDERACHGSSFRTKNIGFLVALQRSIDPSRGLIVATTHLFWHPRYTYERARQAAILVREVLKFRSDIGRQNWPCILSGDFNFAPDDPAYSLLVGDPLLAEQEEHLSSSRVIHVSIDPSVPANAQSPTDEEGDDKTSTDPDRTITNARLALPADGLLSNSELIAFVASSPLRSAYDEGLRKYREFSGNVTTFGDRSGLPSTRRGTHEPEWTSYTHYWKTVLDYIFILDPVDHNSQLVVTGLLEPHRTKDLEPGLPRKGVCGSDHVSLCAELHWTDNLRGQRALDSGLE